jgi:HK97 family phage portal protein
MNFSDMMNFKNLFKPKRIILQNGVKSFMGFGADRQSTAPLGKPTPKSYSEHDGYLNAYADSAWVYACVSRKAQDAAALPLRLYRRGDEENKEVVKHAVLDLLATINGDMTLYDWLEYLFSSLELTGNSYNGVLLPGKAGATIFPYVPSLIEPVISSDASAPISSYRYHVNNTVRDIPREEMFHVKYYSSLKSGYFIGLAPLTAARMAYETDNRALNWNLNKLKKGNSVEGVLETENEYFNDKANRDALMDSWRAKYSGDEGAKIGMLFGGVKFNGLSLSPKDMEFLNQRKMTREEILAVYKVPPAVLGLFEYANYANAEQQEKFYWRNGILPMLRKVEGSLNEKFLKMFPGTDGLFLKFDTSGVQVLQDNEEAKVKIAKMYFDMAVPYNDIAEKLNLPVKEIPGGDIGYIPFSLIPTTQAAQPKPSDDGKRAPKSLKLTDAQKLAKWNVFVKIADVHEAKVKSAVQQYFKVQESDVQIALDEQKSLKKKIVIDDILFDSEGEGKRLFGILKPQYLEVIKAQAAQEIASFNFGISFDLSNPRVAAWIEKHGGEAISEINKTTRDALRVTLAEGVEAGESVPDLAARISKVYDDAIGYRADRIARTETISASNQGAIETYKQTGLKIKKGWLSAGDERTRETHIAAGQKYDDGGAIGLSEDFKVGAGAGAAPGQLGVAEEDINCRCSVYPVVEE